MLVHIKSNHVQCKDENVFCEQHRIAMIPCVFRLLVMCIKVLKSSILG
jgi:hypothetical protein